MTSATSTQPTRDELGGGDRVGEERRGEVE